MKARAFVVTRPGEKDEQLSSFSVAYARMVRNNIEYYPIEHLDMILAALEARNKST
jgi:hypothetical protein